MSVEDGGAEEAAETQPGQRLSFWPNLKVTFWSN